ncbi:cytochrome P450 [Candidatus Mycolicibacterium alkanivorans]|uniref:Cytochrome P450 n=1 Tax=Candidatus Mycolicibacterium alkanivorans TaxID=2954114 RepID=A0ABS9Z017_9MYCO|nr:cytochrome P450 [Candidatus Mycolicibacterium alkanivorans]MCI4676857.1 cytochrome P450 [Candidatus Mycolicibacterium alkanivorans]
MRLVVDLNKVPLLRNQASWDLVRDNPELVPRTVEEVQRLQGSVQFFPSRWATADIDIRTAAGRADCRCPGCGRAGTSAGS